MKRVISSRQACRWRGLKPRIRFENEGGDNSYIDLMIWSMNRTLMKVAPAMIKKGVTKVR